MAQGTLTQNTQLHRAPVSPQRVMQPIVRALTYATVFALCVLFGFPLFWTAMSSLKTIPEMFAFPPILVPAAPQWANYWTVLNIDYPVGRWFINSVLIVVLTSFGTLITASLVAYSFARFEYRGRDILFMITLSTMMLPAQVTLIPAVRSLLQTRLGQHAPPPLGSPLVRRRSLRHLPDASVLPHAPA